MVSVGVMVREQNSRRDRAANRREPAPETAAWPGDLATLYQRAAATRGLAQAIIDERDRIWTRCEATRRMDRVGLAAARVFTQPGWPATPAGRALLRRSEYARMLARLQTLPVIEQAKGVIMEQNGCPEEEAFDLLRRASQRLNVPVRDLAAKMVDRIQGRVSQTSRGRADRRKPGQLQHRAR